MNAILTPLKFIAVNVVGDVLYFPVWWYSRGLRVVVIGTGRRIAGLARALALGILLKNLFRPMYGDYSKSGRAISLVFRTIHLGILLVVFSVVTVVLVAGLILWVVSLPIVFYFITANWQGLM